LDKSLLDVVGKLKESDISYPKRLEYGQGTYGYHIVWLKSRVPQHKVDLKEDYTEVKKLADENKKQKEYSKWIEGLKSKIYWEIKI
jgi:peptidyl-prolyl cis-trans isomerase SurA